MKSFRVFFSSSRNLKKTVFFERYDGFQTSSFGLCPYQLSSKKKTRYLHIRCLTAQPHSLPSSVHTRYRNTKTYGTCLPFLSLFSLFHTLNYRFLSIPKRALLLMAAVDPSTSPLSKSQTFPCCNISYHTNADAQR